MTDLHPNARTVQDALEAAGIDTRVRRLSKETRTAALAAAELECEIGAIANSLVFIADGFPILVMTSGAHRVDEEFFARSWGFTTLESANAEQVREATGQPIGGVAPVGHPEPLRTFVDETLQSYPRIFMGGGAPNSIFGMTYSELVEVTGGTVCRVRPEPAGG